MSYSLKAVLPESCRWSHVQTLCDMNRELLLVMLSLSVADPPALQATHP